jgi:2-polyprenyl-3-methyl-5-hydroxy-6-metoxy-1,4-benzoquinol methylase
MAGASPTKANPYGFGTRPDMVKFVPPSGRLLEVGCSSGGFAYSLRAAGYAGEMWGLEPEPEAAAEAEEQFDQVICGYFPADAPAERFDTVVFNDVLEHLLDPWMALRATIPLLDPGGRVVASIPNIRYWPVSRDLLLRGHWTYTETGTLDRTHLRFFTRETIASLFAEAGYRVEQIAPTNLIESGGIRSRYVNWLPKDVRALQYAVVATPTPGGYSNTQRAVQ